MSITLILLLVFLGVVTGFYSGLIGTGGNIIVIPAIDILFVYFEVAPHDSVKLIIAHSLFVTVFLGFSVSFKQYRIGNFHLKEVLLIGIPGMLTAFGITELIKAGNWYDKNYFDLVFLFLMILLAVRMLFFKAKVNTDPSNPSNQPKKKLLAGAGLLTGCVTSLSGLGGGVILIPFLTDVVKKPITKASSISIGVITLLAIAVSSSYLLFTKADSIPSVLPYQTGYISIPLVIPILVGVFLSTSFGVKVAQKTDPKKLRIIFGVIILVIIAKMLHSLLW
ncbi:MAG: sulfite exporter TauE/SafE family protein [Balneolaceae bacterium]